MKHTALAATVLLAALSGFAKTFDVDVSSGRPAASNGAYYHGETIEFRAVRGGSVVTNIEYASIYYQTNGMGDVWWRTDGLTFHPTNDVGAASYRFFMEGREIVGSGGVDSPTPSLTHSPTISRDWHANGLLRLLPSPGFAPNTLQLPVATLDFAAVEVLNPPWTEEIGNVARQVASNETAIASTARQVATAREQITTFIDALEGKADSDDLLDYVPLDGDSTISGDITINGEVSINGTGGLGVQGGLSVYGGSAALYGGIAIGPAGDQRIDGNQAGDKIIFEGHGEDGPNRSELQPDGSDVMTSNRAAAAISNIVTKSYVEDLGISADFSTNNTALVATIEATAPAPGNYAAVSNAAMNALSRAEAEAGFTEWELSGLPNGVTNIYGPEFSAAESTYRLQFLYNGNYYEGWGASSEDVTSNEFNCTDYSESYITVTATRVRLPTMADIPTEQINAATTTNALQDTAIESNKVSIASNAAAISTLGDSISTLSNTTSTVSSGLSQLADEVAPAVNGYARLYSFVTGSTNANFVVTNYQLTAEAEAARTHFDPSDPDLDFSTVPPSLRLEDASSGTNRVVVDTRDWTVWYYAQKIGGAMAEAVSTAVDTCRAWCGFTATGLENPAPDTLVVDVPNIWLMAGKTFEKHIAGSNAVWIIRSSGVVMPISDNSQSAGGFLELTDAFGTPYIRFKKTESYFVDPAADGVEYDSATGAWLVTYTTTTRPKGGANAVLEGSTTYPGKAILKDEDDPDCPATITWTGSANNWVMHAVPKQIDGAVPPKMFFAAVVEVQGQDYIEYLRPMSVPRLMFNGATYAPTVNGNKLEFIAQ